MGGSNINLLFITSRYEFVKEELNYVVFNKEVWHYVVDIFGREECEKELYRGRKYDKVFIDREMISFILQCKIENNIKIIDTLELAVDNPSENIIIC